MPKLILDGDSRGAVRATTDITKEGKKLGDVMSDTGRKSVDAIERLRAAGRAAADEEKKQATTHDATINRRLARFQELGNAYRAQIESQRQLAAAQSGAFGSGALSNIKSYLTGVVSVSAAIALVRNELREVQQEAERVTQSKLTGAQARDVLKRNIAPLGLERAGKFEARAERTARELGLPQRVIDVALAEAYSASGDVEASFSRTRIAAEYLKTSPEQIGTFAGSLGDIARATKSNNDLRNLGFLGTIGAMSRVADASQQARTLPPALVGGVSFGMTAEQAGALWSALTVSTGDIRGDASGTGVIRATEQLRDFFDKKTQKGLVAKGADTFGGRMALLRAQPDLAREFIADASFEAKVKGPLQEFFLDPNSAVAQQYARNLASMGTEAQQIQSGRDTLQMLRRGGLARTAATERAIGTGIEGIRLASPSELSEEAREGIIQTLARANQGSITGARWGVALRTGETMSPAEAVRELQAALPRAETVMRRLDAAFETKGSILETAPSEIRARYAEEREAQRALIDNTRQMIGQLQAIREENKRPPASGRQE